MMTNRILLEDMFRQIARVMPPYSIFNPERPAGSLPEGYEIEQMSDDELADVLVANSLGVPMTLPLYLKREGEEWWLLPFEPQIQPPSTLRKPLPGSCPMHRLPVPIP